MCQPFVFYFLWNSWERIESPLGQDLSDGLRLRPGFVVPLLRIEGLTGNNRIPDAGSSGGV